MEALGRYISISLFNRKGEVLLPNIQYIELLTIHKRLKTSLFLQIIINIIKKQIINNVLLIIYRSPMIERLSEGKDIHSWGENVKLIPTLSVRKTAGFKPWECSACGKFFLSHSSLNRHMSCHIEYKPREHQKYHKKVYKCKNCGQTFVSPSALRTHKRREALCM